MYQLFPSALSLLLTILCKLIYN